MDFLNDVDEFVAGFTVDDMLKNINRIIIKSPSKFRHN